EEQDAAVGPLDDGAGGGAGEPDHVVIEAIPAGHLDVDEAQAQPGAVVDAALTVNDPPHASRWAVATWRATSVTRSGVKPKFTSSCLSGADAPKVCIPTTAPASPT